MQLDYTIHKLEIDKILGKSEAILNSKIRSRSSGYVVDYPLVCFAEDESPGTLVFSHIDQTEENNRMLSLQLSGEVLLYGQMITTSHCWNNLPATNVKIGALTLDLHA